MAENASKGRISDRTKLAAVPVLVVVLLYVANDDEPSSSAPVTVTSPAASSFMSATGSLRPSPSGDRVQPGDKAWPRLPLEEIVDHNPFAYPAGLLPAETATVAVETPVAENGLDLQAEAARRQKLLEDWQASDPSVIYRSPSGVVALIGTQVVREGDVLDDVVQVVSVNASGIVFELVED